MQEKLCFFKRFQIQKRLLKERKCMFMNSSFPTYVLVPKYFVSCGKRSLKQERLNRLMYNTDVVQTSMISTNLITSLKTYRPVWNLKQYLLSVLRVILSGLSWCLHPDMQALLVLPAFLEMFLKYFCSSAVRKHKTQKFDQTCGEGMAYKSEATIYSRESTFLTSNY